MLNQTLATQYHQLPSKTHPRKLGFSQWGNRDASKVFVCLPGLLETRECFAPLIRQAQEQRDCCWITLDYCGRGDSDHLPTNTRYSMSVYLKDIEHFLAQLMDTQGTLSAGRPNTEIYLVGSSMGGILAIFLAYKFEGKIAGLVLNDIGLSLHWSALIKLYKQFGKGLVGKKHEALLVRIDPNAVKAVQSPTHFDLPYEFGLLGMRFHSMLRNYRGLVLLVHNSKSVLCPTAIAKISKQRFPRLKVFTIQSEGHPALWRAQACQWLFANVGSEPNEEQKLRA